MIVRVFYNHRSFPNVWMIRCDERNVERTETKGDVTILYHQDAIVGYTVINAPAFSQDGYQMMDEALLQQINERFQHNGCEPILHDFTPYLLVGYVEECTAHPDSDHLHVCVVDVGSKKVQIVCGAHNVARGQYVVAALENAVLPNGTLIQNGKLRGVESFGMLCSAYELGLIEEKKKGILILGEDAVIGTAFNKRG
ncbi:MAG: YtpR family tRNA-binding protein [Erysipelotrichaceae bacterium]